MDVYKYERKNGVFPEVRGLRYPVQINPVIHEKVK
jgi:hypothetical protein